MVIHVGFISPWPTFPTSYTAVTGRDASGATSTVTLGPPGVELGDLMVACVGAGSWSAGTPWTLTPPAGWSTNYATSETVDQVFANLYTKIADQNDVDGISSYTWAMTVAGGLAGLAVTVVSWPKRFGTTLGGATHSASGAPSIASPGGQWQLAFNYQRSASSFLQPAPDPVVTSPATLLASNTGSDGSRAGNGRVYASDNVTPITGDYLTSGIDFSRPALVVAAVS